jgi:hypothetical protein
MHDISFNLIFFVSHQNEFIAYSLSELILFKTATHKILYYAKHRKNNSCYTLYNFRY